MPKRFNMTIRMNASHDEISVTTDAGTTTVDRSEFNKHERQSLTELIVDAFCDHSLFKPLYGG